MHPLSVVSLATVAKENRGFLLLQTLQVRLKKMTLGEYLGAVGCAKVQGREEAGIRTHLDAIVDGALFHMRGVGEC